MAETKTVWSTGRRKTSIARIRLLSPGQGKLLVNEKPIERYFAGQGHQKNKSMQPLAICKTPNTYDIYVHVSGGGMTAQAEAIRHGISRALAQIDPNVSVLLRKEGLLKRDPRMVERKKYGQAKARKRFQWTKR